MTDYTQLNALLPLSVGQWLRKRLGYRWIQVRRFCAFCGQRARGNRITGYYMPCQWKHRYELFGQYMRPMD